MSDSSKIDVWLGHLDTPAESTDEQRALELFHTTPLGFLVCKVCGQRAYPGAAVLRRCLLGHWKCGGCGRMLPVSFDGTKPRVHRNCRGAKGVRGVPVVELPPARAGDTYSTEASPGHYVVYRYSGHGWWRISG